MLLFICLAGYDKYDDFNSCVEFCPCIFFVYNLLRVEHSHNGSSEHAIRGERRVNGKKNKQKFLHGGD
jgi:hypothetical protein